MCTLITSFGLENHNKVMQSSFLFAYILILYTLKKSIFLALKQMGYLIIACNNGNFPLIFFPFDNSLVHATEKSIQLAVAQIADTFMIHINHTNF